MGRSSDSMLAHTEAHDAYQYAGEEGQDGTIATLCDIATVHSATGKHADGLATLRRAKSLLATSSLGPDAKAWHLLVIVERGANLLIGSQDYASAVEHYATALTMSEQVHGNNSDSFANLLRNTGMALMATRQFTAAADHFARAQALFRLLGMTGSQN